MMGKIRPFCLEDIPQVVQLNSRLFPGSASLSPEVQASHFEEICFHNPWFDPEITSLVHEEADGRISGFMGIIPRQVTFNGTPLRLAVGQHLMVDRATLAGLQLFKRFVSGPQDISMADMAVDVTRKLWERVSGTTVFLHSIFWAKLLRPTSFAVSYLKRNKLFSHATPFLKPFSSGIDAMLNRESFKSLHIRRPSTQAEELTTTAILSCFPKFSTGRHLLPVYSQQSLEWLFIMLEKEVRFGSFRKLLVKDKAGAIIGWFMYYRNPSGRSEVIQVVGTEETFGNILDHLFYDAWKQGCSHLRGRIDPLFIRTFSDKFCLFTPGSNWMLIHSNIPEVINAVNSGHVFLSRLEGDLWFF